MRKISNNLLVNLFKYRIAIWTGLISSNLILYDRSMLLESIYNIVIDIEYNISEQLVQHIGTCLQLFVNWRPLAHRKLSH